jgi:hypothetical protein
MNKCPPCHGDCNQGRTCNAEPTIATLMLEVNRLSVELEKEKAKIGVLANSCPDNCFNKTAHLDSSLSQEPVAWWDGNPKNAIGISKIKECDDWQPLYTAPRELSDEEIREVAKKHLGHSMGLLNWHSFAKAILKKASEK